MKITREHRLHYSSWLILKQLVLHIRDNLMENRCLESAAALTLASLFALVPVLAVVYWVLSLIPSMGGVGDQIQGWLFAYWVPHDEFDIQSNLTQFRDQTSRLTAIGALMLLVTAMMMLKRIEGAFNRIWQVEETRRGVMSFVRYWAILSLGPLLFLAGIVVTSYLLSVELLSSTVASFNKKGWGLSVLPFITSWMAFSLLNLIVPNCKVPIRSAVLGGLFSSLGFEAAKKVFGAFIAHFPSYELVYGAFAAIPLFVIWLYVSWVIVLSGGVMARALSLVSAGGDLGHHDRGQVLGMHWLVVLRYFWLAQQQCQVVEEARVTRSLKGVVSQGQWEVIRNRLLKKGYVHKTQAGDLVLAGDVASISVERFLHDMAVLPQLRWEALQANETWQVAFSEHVRGLSSQVSAGLQLSLRALFATDAFLSDTAAFAVETQSASKKDQS